MTIESEEVDLGECKDGVANYLIRTHFAVNALHYHHGVLCCALLRDVNSKHREQRTVLGHLSLNASPGKIGKCSGKHVLTVIVTDDLEYGTP